MGNFILDDPNIDTTNLSPEQIDFSYLITGNPKKRTIPFRPDLVNICNGSAWAVILFDQIYYWLEWKSEKENKPITSVEIFKFIEPCEHPWYKKGDSFLEELKITKWKFKTALKNISFKINKKTTIEEIKNSNALILYRKDINNLSWYKLNPFILSVLQNNQITKTANPHFAKVGTSLTEKCRPHIRIYRENNTKNTSFNSSKEESKGLNNNKLVAKQLNENKRISDQGTLRVEADASDLQRIKGLNGSSFLIKKKIKSLPKLKKIIVPDNPLHKFGFPQEVFEVLNYWRLAGGKIPKDPKKGRKIADNISHLIQALFLPGNNPYTSVLNESELEQFREKKWNMQEIKDSINHYTKELCKNIESMPFNQFIIHQNFKNSAKKHLRDYSPLVLSFQQLPQQLSYLAKKLKNNFTSNFPDIHFYDKTFINIASFLEEKLNQYKSYQPYSGIYFEERFIDEIFFIYMTKKVQPKGTYEELKYMANPQNLREFILWCIDLNLIKGRTDKEIKNYRKDIKKEYKNQIKAYQNEINSGKADSKWSQEKWEYFEFLKEKVEC